MRIEAIVKRNVYEAHDVLKLAQNHAKLTATITGRDTSTSPVSLKSSSPALGNGPSPASLHTPGAAVSAELPKHLGQIDWIISAYGLWYEANRLAPDGTHLHLARSF